MAYLVYFNLENFSVFNERYGFEAGDNLLSLTAVSLKMSFPGYLLARISEDHFLLVCESLDIERGICDARDLLQALGRRVTVALKAGIFAFDDEHVSIGVACDKAKAACDSISHRYDLTFRWYDQALSWYDERRKYIENNIDRAISHGWIKVFFQPIVRSVTGEVCEFEALARWDDPHYGMLSPAVFVEVLERARLIHKLDAHVVRVVCQEWRRLRAADEWWVPVSINLSRLDFELCDAFEMVNSLANAYDVPHQMLHVEITESAINEKSNLLAHEIVHFRNANYQVWLDDFGSGYSSLNTLKDYVFDVVKIDMAFLREFDSKPQSLVIISSIVNMAKQLGMQTLIEGVETPEQYDFLRGIGCEFVQGYLIGRPEPIERNIERIEAGELAIEDTLLHGYYDRLGAINSLSATPFEFPWEAPASERPFAEMLPLAIVEMRGAIVNFMTANDAFVEVLREAGMGSMSKFADRINTLADRQARSVREALRTAIASGEIESVDVLENGQHCVFRTRHVVSHEGVDALLVSLINLTRFSDVSEEQLLQTSLRYLYAVYDLVNVVNVATRDASTIYRGSSAFPAVTKSKTAEEELQFFVNKYIHPDDRSRYLDFMDFSAVRGRVEATDKNYLTEAFRTLGHHGTYRWFTCALVPIEVDGEDTVLVCMRGINQEVVDTVSGETEIPKSVLWDTLLELVPAGVFWKDADRRFLGVNRNFLEFYEFGSVNDLLGKNDEDMGWHVDEGPFMNDEMRVIKLGESVLNAHGTCIAHGEVRNIVASKIPLRRNGEVVGLMGYFTDQTDAQAGNDGFMENGFERLARTDHLTGIASLVGLASSALSYVDSYRRNGVDFAYVAANICDMGGLNEVYGLSFGNRILKVVAKSLERACSVNRVVARVGGDKFAVLYKASNAAEAAHEAQRLRGVVESITEVDGIPVRLGCSIGWALFSETEDLTSMLALVGERMQGCS